MQQLLDEYLKLALKGRRLKNRRSTLHSRVPKSNESLVQNSSNLFGKELDSTDAFLSTTPPSYPFRAKSGFAAFIPALAG